MRGVNLAARHRHHCDAAPGEEHPSAHDEAAVCSNDWALSSSPGVKRSIPWPTRAVAMRGGPSNRPEMPKPAVTQPAVTQPASRWPVGASNSQRPPPPLDHLLLTLSPPHAGIQP